MKLEAEVLAALENMKVSDHKGKDDVRRMLHKRKLGNLKKHYKSLKAQQLRALSLLKRPDFEQLEPTLAPVSKADQGLWLYCRHIVSSAPYNGRIGRMIQVWCMDKRTKGILGVLELNSDLNMIGLRENLIGWDTETKYRNLRKICNVGTCVGTAPFGAVVGGKFQIVAVLSNEARGWWMSRYSDPMLAVTTTSLYGKSSIYNRLKEYRYLGTTLGQGVANIDDKTAALFKRFLAENDLLARSGFGAGMAGGRQDVLNRVTSVLKFPIEKISSKTPKGVYLAECGDGALDCLAERSNTWTPIDRTMDEIRAWWTERWYHMRLPKVLERIQGFDWNEYSLDYQIGMMETETIEHASEASDDRNQRDSGGLTPARMLQTSNSHQIN